MTEGQVGGGFAAVAFMGGLALEIQQRAAGNRAFLMLFVLALAFVFVAAALFWHLGYKRAERIGNKALLDYARGSGDMLAHLGAALPDPRSLADQIQDYLAAHHYTVKMTDTVGLASRPDGSRAFTFTMKKPTFLPDLDWTAMLMSQIQYQVHKDLSGQYFTNTVIPIDRPPSTMPPERPQASVNRGLAR